jgi:hypothetical protein
MLSQNCSTICTKSDLFICNDCQFRDNYYNQMPMFYAVLSVRLAESCSHVGAVLYAVDTGVRMCDSVTCTMEKSKWLMPSHVNKVRI